MAQLITLQLPDRLYHHLINTAHATQRPLEAVILRALEVGSPPDWDDVPETFQADLAALDRLDDATLWTVALGRKAASEMTRYDDLLDRNREGTITDEDWSCPHCAPKQIALYCRKRKQPRCCAGAGIRFRRVNACGLHSS